VNFSGLTLNRKLEVQIAKYQDFLRQKIYTSELDIYKKIGEMKFEEFYEYYEEEFKKVIHLKYCKDIYLVYSSTHTVWTEKPRLELYMKISSVI
jgi:hypothetical protein